MVKSFLLFVVGLMAVGVLALQGCDHKPVTDEEVKQHVNYFQDKRTGLCYALMDSGLHGTGIALVPCEKVQQLLDNPWTR